MHSKPQKRTAERLTCRENWKSCLPAKTKARARIPPPFLQPSCALRSRFEAVLKGVREGKLHALQVHPCAFPALSFLYGTLTRFSSRISSATPSPQAPFS